MTEYTFTRRSPSSQRVILAISLEIRKQKERVWIGPEREILSCMHGHENAAFLADTRPLGAFLEEFGKVPADGWSQALRALFEALTARRAVKAEKERQAAAFLSQRVVSGFASQAYAAIRLWELYLQALTFSNKKNAVEYLKDKGHLLILPFGDEDLERIARADCPVIPVLNSTQDARLEIWYPNLRQPVECAVAEQSLRPAMIYYWQRIRDAELVPRTCTNCGRLFFAPNGKHHLCSERCRKASKKKVRAEFESKAMGQPYEQAYEREYMFWYNRVAKLKKGKAPPEKIEAAQKAMKAFRTQAVRNKERVKTGALTARSFSDWLIEQEQIILSIVGE